MKALWKKHIRKLAAFATGAIVLALGFSLGNTGTAQAAACENPDALTFAMVPTEETIAELQLYKPITDRMAKLTGKKIQFFMPTSYASVVEGLLSKFVDVAVLGPYTYVIANSKDSNVEVFATYAKKPGHMQEEGPGYRAALRLSRERPLPARRQGGIGQAQQRAASQ